METFEIKFNQLLFEYKKYECGVYVKELLNNNYISIEKLYEVYFTNALLTVGNDIEDNNLKIWEEHSISSIIMYLLEQTYEYIYQNKMSKINKSVLIACPQMELHEAGAKMSAYLFEYAGFECNYIGANTPNNEIINAIDIYKSDIVAISVSSRYNLINLKKLVSEIKLKFSDVDIVIGGSAIKVSKIKDQLDGVIFINKFDEILTLRGDYNV